MSDETTDPLMRPEVIGRDQVRRALRRERDFIKALLDTTDALVVVLDPRGRIVRFNRTSERTTGYTFAEVKGRIFWDLFLLPQEVESVKAVFAGLVAGHDSAANRSYTNTSRAR